jgi:uncharacterized protein
MCDDLHTSVDAMRSVDGGRSFVGRVELTSLPRVAPLLMSSNFGEEQSGACAAEYALRFGRDEAGRATVRGNVRGLLRLRCERCNAVLELPVDSDIALAIVQGLDEASRLPDVYDPLLLEDGSLDLRSLVEDELLLAVPAIPRHEAGVCRAPDYEQPDRPFGTGNADTNPFAVLETLKRRH